MASYVLPTVSITSPADGGKLKGEAVATGNATKGSREVVRVDVRIDSGPWYNATGTGSWQYSLDTKKLKNGPHTLDVRAFDGYDFSIAGTVQFSVKNQAAKAASSNDNTLVIVAFVVLLAAIAGIAAFMMMRKKRGPEVARPISTPQEPAPPPPPPPGPLTPPSTSPQQSSQPSPPPDAQPPAVPPPEP